jgi:DNA-binding Lrp family transcriptional regulator
MTNQNCTIYKNIFAKKAYHLSVEECLERIKNGKSKDLIETIRVTLDKDRSSEMKRNLPSVCFSGIFESERKDDLLVKHSGYIILDFDDVEDVETYKHELFAHKFIKACWVSPSGNGVKALVKIASSDKHREHFMALQEQFPLIDRSGVNPSRVCYESYDPEIFVRDEVEPFTKIKTIDRIVEKTIESDAGKTFDRILKWLTNKGDAFVTGERNLFIFKLASACCRFGLSDYDTERFIHNSILMNDNSFSGKEATQAIQSAFKSNANKAGSAYFEKDILIERTSREEIKLDEKFFDVTVRPKDVLFGEDVKEDAMKLYDFGYESAETTEIPELDVFWKWKKGELTLLSGIGNYGKSSFLKYILLMKSIKKGWKWALFAPEDFPAHEFYHDLVEMYIGEDMTPRNFNRKTRELYEQVYDWVSKHFFFVYPKEISSTPDYIKERFLELIIKEQVNGVVIDPFNQMDNDYSKVGGRDDKYLEIVLSDFKRFAQVNDIPFLVVAHPKLIRNKDPQGNYECPDVFDIAGGAMNNNKYDNIMIYHRPLRHSDPQATNCELHTKKIKRQKIVGSIGVLSFNLKKYTRRYLFESQVDYVQQLVSDTPEFEQQEQFTTPLPEIEDFTPPF